LAQILGLFGAELQQKRPFPFQRQLEAKSAYENQRDSRAETINLRARQPQKALIDGAVVTLSRS
jgi:hypothetical protein